MYVLLTTLRNTVQQLSVRSTWFFCENQEWESIYSLNPSKPAYQDSDEYAETVRKRMQKAYRIVSEQLKATFDRAKRRYDQRINREVRFKLNSYVWFYCPKLHAGRGRNFRKLTDGPYRIIKILNDVNYVIQKNPGSRPQICHVDRLLKYEGETPKVWLRYDAEQAKKESIPANTIQSETRNQTSQIVAMGSEIQDSMTRNTELIIDEERPNSESQQTKKKSIMRVKSVGFQPGSNMEARNDADQRGVCRISYARSVAMRAIVKNGICRQNAAESAIT